MAPFKNITTSTNVITSSSSKARNNNNVPNKDSPSSTPNNSTAATTNTGATNQPSSTPSNNNDANNNLLPTVEFERLIILNLRAYPLDLVSKTHMRTPENTSLPIKVNLFHQTRADVTGPPRVKGGSRVPLPAGESCAVYSVYIILQSIVL